MLGLCEDQISGAAKNEKPALILKPTEETKWLFSNTNFPNKVNIIFLGAERVGKNSIINRYKVIFYFIYSIF